MEKVTSSTLSAEQAFIWILPGPTKQEKVATVWR
jgi:hypothetical protein